MQDLTTSRRQMITNMKTCEQSQGYSTLQHGLDVWKTFKGLCKGSHLAPIPNWYAQNWKSLGAQTHDFRTCALYTIFHDCGKFSCLTIDDNGRRHFPDHANVSADLFSQLWPAETKIANLMRWDMVLHTCSALELAECLTQWSIEDQNTLLLSSLAELHANSFMFGGHQTQSFKTKFTRLERRGNQILKCRKA